MTTDHYGVAAVPAGVPQEYRFSAELPTLLDAQRLCDQFPKSCGMRANTLHTYDESGESVMRGHLSARGDLVADGANHGRNETGIRRYRAILRAAAKLGLAVEYRAEYRSSYPTREAFEAAIA